MVLKGYFYFQSKRIVNEFQGIFQKLINWVILIMFRDQEHIQKYVCN